MLLELITHFVKSFVADFHCQGKNYVNHQHQRISQCDNKTHSISYSNKRTYENILLIALIIIDTNNNTGYKTKFLLMELYFHCLNYKLLMAYSQITARWVVFFIVCH
jgi:hypothetical protein